MSPRCDILRSQVPDFAVFWLLKLCLRAVESGILRSLPMANDQAKKALREAREAIAAVHDGRVNQSAGLRFEGVRAYSVTTAEVRRPTPTNLRVRKRSTGA